MFKEKELVIYQKRVCQIKNIKDDGEYYVLVPIDDTSLTINVPTNNHSGLLRKIISRAEVERIISEIPQIEVLDGINDNMLEHEYKKLFTFGSHEDLVKIIKTTYLRNDNRLKNKKKTSEKDNAYFEKAERLLYNEFSIALGLDYDATKEYVKKQVKKNVNK